MAVPEFQSFMLPVLDLFKDDNIHTANECMNKVVEYFNLNEKDTKLMIPSKKQTLVANRVYWALTYLKKSKLLETVKRGEYKITERGKKLLKTSPNRIDKKLLSQYDEYRLFSKQDNDKQNISINEDVNDEVTPEEKMYLIHKKMEDQTAEDLLEIILGKDPYCFERIVMDVLKRMGYGDINEDSSVVTKKSNDGGIDGIINQDRLGLDKIYVQAKRWTTGQVGRPEIQKFVGAITGKNATKGIFITTSSFTKEAKEYVLNLPKSIVLIDGKELTKLMIENNVGVQNNYVYEVKRIDNDYFEMF